MNEFEYFLYDDNNLENLKSVKPEKENQGFFYIVEYGSAIKIGSTTRPYHRYLCFKREAKYNGGKIGMICVSCSHYNYRANEKALHRRYQRDRVEGTELFDLPFLDTIHSCFDGLSFEKEKSPINEEKVLEGFKKLIPVNPFVKRNNALLTAIIANNPTLLLGDSDTDIIQDDLEIALEYNQEIERCLTELGISVAVPFLKECRQIVQKEGYEPLRDVAEDTGEKILKKKIQIPLEMIQVMEEGGIYEFSNNNE